MSHYIIRPGGVSGEISIPSSKSQTLRSILFAALADGKSFIRSPLESLDSFAMIKACKSLGASIKLLGNDLEIEGVKGNISFTEDVIDAGNSGLILRFISAIAALGNQPVVITGDHSIQHQRPMGVMLQALQQLGVRAESTKKNGFAPVIIQGPFRGGSAIISGQDSQPISALLMAGALCAEGLSLEVTEPGEKPWIDMTLQWLCNLGVQVKQRDYCSYQIRGGAVWSGFDYKVPGDWSSAAFPIAAALITNSSLTINNINSDDPQGDKKIIEILRKMNANIELQETKLHISSGQSLKGIEIDINDCIDAITILSVIACYASGTTRIKNAAVARNKECNRISCITSELKKMGANIQETEDGVVVTGTPLHGEKVQSYHDHRMAMSLAIAGLGASSPTVIHDADCVSKTYDSFSDDMKAIGADLEVVR